VGAEQIKRRTFELARRRFPYAKLFSITTSLPVMKLNSRMGSANTTLIELLFIYFYVGKIVV